MTAVFHFGCKVLGIEEALDWINVCDDCVTLSIPFAYLKYLLELRSVNISEETIEFDSPFKFP